VTTESLHFDRKVTRFGDETIVLARKGEKKKKGNSFTKRRKKSRSVFGVFADAEKIRDQKTKE